MFLLASGTGSPPRITLPAFKMAPRASSSGAVAGGRGAQAPGSAIVTPPGQALSSAPALELGAASSGPASGFPPFPAGGTMRLLAAGILLLGCSAPLCAAFYLPGLAPVSFCEPAKESESCQVRAARGEPCVGARRCLAGPGSWARRCWGRASLVRGRWGALRVGAPGLRHPAKGWGAGGLL